MHIVFIIQKSQERIWHVETFGNVGFPKETRYILLFIKKYAKTSKFSYMQIVSKSSMLNVV